MCGVVNNFQIVLLGDSLNCLDIAWVTIHVCRENSRCSGRDGRFDQFRIDIECRSVDIHKNRRAVFPQDRIGSRHVGERRGDDLAFQFQRLDRYLQNDRSVTAKVKVIDIQILFKLSFELL